MREVDITNKVYNRLTAIRKSDEERAWLFKCTCGREVSLDSRNVKSGKSKSCGCLKREIQTKHSMNRTRFYMLWAGMKQRCTNPKCTHYSRYGGRGIGFCEEWVSFNGFLEDMHDSYLLHLNAHGEKNTTLDRIDSNRNYEKSNCKWSTRKEQANNTSTNVNHLVGGEKMNNMQISKKFNIDYSTIKTKLKKGMSIDEIIKTKGRVM